MPRSSDYIKGYANGYQTAVQKKWNPNKPPHPPEPLVRALSEAARMLRDRADDFIAATDEGDDTTERALGPGIDAVDAANKRITEWLAAPSQQ